MRANGAYTCLVSGGFTLFTTRVAEMIGFQENRANELLDELLSTAMEPAPDYRGSTSAPAAEQRAAAPALAIVKVDLGLRNRELRTAADVEALVDEVRKRLLDKINQGVRVRLS